MVSSSAFGGALVCLFGLRSANTMDGTNLEPSQWEKDLSLGLSRRSAHDIGIKIYSRQNKLEKKSSES